MGESAVTLALLRRSINKPLGRIAENAVPSRSGSIPLNIRDFVELSRRSVAMIRQMKNTMGGRSALAASFFVFTLAGISADSNWPQFRGSQAGVAADDPALPETWSPTENIVWKADVPGVGWGSPVVWGDHIFLT